MLDEDASFQLISHMFSSWRGMQLLNLSADAVLLLMRDGAGLGRCPGSGGGEDRSQTKFSCYPAPAGPLEQCTSWPTLLTLRDYLVLLSPASAGHFSRTTAKFTGWWSWSSLMNQEAASAPPPWQAWVEQRLPAVG